MAVVGRELSRPGAWHPELTDLAATSQGTALINLNSEAVQAPQVYVTGNLFPMLGVRPEQGRLILPSDDRLDQPVVAVLSDEFWRTKLGADPAIVGKTLSIDGIPTAVIGITPSDFRVPIGGQILRADVWMPIRFRPNQLTQRRSNFLQLVGRLADGATPESAAKRASAVYSRYRRVIPSTARRGRSRRRAPVGERPIHSDAAAAAVWRGVHGASDRGHQRGGAAPRARRAATAGDGRAHRTRRNALGGNASAAR